MTRLPPCPPPPPSDITRCLPDGTPAAARQTIEALVEAWRQSIREHQGGQAELARLATLPDDMAASEILEAHRAAVASIEAAVLDWMQQRQRLAAAFSEVRPLAREDAREARLAVERRRGEVAIATRQADLLASDKAVEDALAADSKLSDLRAAAGQAEWRLKTIERYEAPGNGGRIGLWCRDRLAVEVPA